MVEGLTISSCGRLWDRFRPNRDGALDFQKRRGWTAVRSKAGKRTRGVPHLVVPSVPSAGDIDVDASLAEWAV
jgi:hypothetical protein